MAQLHSSIPPLEFTIPGNKTDTTVILLHGRGGSGSDIAAFAKHHLPPAKYIALEADNNEWYPMPFMQPRKNNQPHLSYALDLIRDTIAKTALPTEKIVICGFSQGACLASEYAARYPSKYKGIIVFSGGLIGDKYLPPEKSLLQTPMLFGCCENDPYIPIERAKISAEAFRKQNAKVTECFYPGHTHAITDKEIKLASSIISS